MKKASFELGNARLLRLADILSKVDKQHEKKDEPAYYQGAFVHECGTPACALGHYAHATPERWKIVKYSATDYEYYDDPKLRHESSGNVFYDAKKEFCLSDREADRLFDSEGCGEALNGKEAAAFIRKFVKDRCKAHDKEMEG